MAADILAAELTHLALCWRLVRQDGVALGFTTHDGPLLIDGLLHDSAPGMAPSAVVQGEGLDVDTMDVAGALTADAVTAADLAAGRWDGAALRLFLVDWRDPDGGRQGLAEGTLGTVASGGGRDSGFAATLIGPNAALAETVIESCSPECRAELGDARCRVSLRGRVRRSTVTAGDGGSVTVAGIAAADHAEGRLRVLAGPAAGLDRRILGTAGAALLLDEPLSLAPGTPVRLTEGCDKRFATCRDRFANAVNFRGEPHVPGGDLLTRFGGN